MGRIDEGRSGRTGEMGVHGIAIHCDMGRERWGKKREVCTGI